VSFVYVICLGVSTAGFASGSFFLKRFADHGLMSDLMTAYAIFAISNLAYAAVMTKGLGQAVVLSGLSQMLLVSAIGVLVFGERLAPAQLAGLFLSVVSVWLFASKSGDTAAL